MHVLTTNAGESDRHHCRCQAACGQLSRRDRGKKQGRCVSGSDEFYVVDLPGTYSLGDVDPEDAGSLSERLQSAPGWGPVTAFSLILFTIFYSPCFVTVVCIAKESGSWKWGAFSMVFNTLLALGVSIGFFQTATWVLS